MIAQIVLKQIAGGSLKFQPGNSMGFTKGGNYVTIKVPTYGSATYVNLGFNETQPDSFDSAQFTTGTNFEYPDIPVGSADFVNEAISAGVVASTIAYLKSFNSTSDFEVSELAPLPV